ncbi:MAG: DUF2231 domain-containing protein [Deltaproteobacteria bacterium]
MAVEKIHPMIVHFPIALLITSLFFDFLMLVTKKEGFERTAFHLLILGVLGSFAAIVFGILAEDAAGNRPGIHDIIETHELLAVSTAGLFVIILIVRYIFMKKGNFQAIRPYYLIAAILGVALLLTTAYYGGQLVYEYGAAVSPAILK